jgi:hypothetical protein
VRAATIVAWLGQNEPFPSPASAAASSADRTEWTSAKPPKPAAEKPPAEKEPAAHRDAGFDPLFADIERQLEQALRRPEVVNRTAKPQPPAPPVEPPPPAAAPEVPPPAPPRPPERKPTSLEEEMASLLGRDFNRDKK